MAKLSSFLIIGALTGFSIGATTLSKHQDDTRSKDLHISDSLICNDVECYPKVFEANSIWTEIKPGQHLPGGLDVRMNFETGLKEAKLADDESNTNPNSNIPVAIQEADEAAQVSSYEFTQEFDMIRSLINSDLESNMETISTKLDDLMVFAHDYKHGYDIITHEFDLLKRISFDENLPSSLRDLSTIMITSCTRNNPRVVEYINERYSGFVNQLYEKIAIITATGDRSASHIRLLKRYLSLLDELTTESFNFTEFELSALESSWKIPDKQVRIEVLELISKLFTIPTNAGDGLLKKDIPKDLPIAQMWADNIQKMIQDKDIDELHTRKFFDSLYAIKQEFKDVKIETSFLNWLSRQAAERKKQLDDGLKERDLEQDSFDKKMIESRHLIFGNPLAHRMKNWDDEL